MRSKRLFAVGAVVAALSVATTACSATPKAEDNSSSNQKTSLTAGWNQPFYSYNELSGSGNATANANIKYMMNSQFWYYDENSELKADKSFGTYEKTSDNPLTVKYTVADGVKWSDGTPVDAADLLLYWASSSGHVNTTSDVKSNDDGSVVVPKGQVFFNGTDPGMALVTKQPEIGDGGKSITFVYDKPFADWAVDMSVSMPAHVIAEKALGITDATKAKDAFLKAVQDKDNVALAKIANFWNTGFDYTKLPSDKELYLSNGPYLMKDFKENQYITLVPNPDYKGDHKASIDTLTVRYNGDPMSQVQALQNGEIDLFSPQVTTDVVKAAEKVKNVQIKGGSEGTYEHIDLKMGNGGPFDPKSYGGDANKALLVRQAFLHAVPRQEIIDKLIKPINPDAIVRDSFLKTPGFPGYDEIAKANGMSDYDKTDAATSKKLLQQAGVKTPIDVKMLFDKANTRRVNEFELMQPALKAAGFNLINLSDPNWGALLASPKYDAQFFGWQSTNTGVTQDQATYGTGGQNNFVKYSNKTVDGLFNQLLTTTDTTEQLDIQTKIDTQLVKDAIGLTIFQFPSATIWNKSRVTGVKPALLAPTMFYNFWNWKTPTS